MLLVAYGFWAFKDKVCLRKQLGLLLLSPVDFQRTNTTLRALVYLLELNSSVEISCVNSAERTNKGAATEGRLLDTGMDLPQSKDPTGAGNTWVQWNHLTEEPSLRLFKHCGS